jgi:HD-GYP domain-containing protein (c-di-GMP phosphodiesterase class II)
LKRDFRTVGPNTIDALSYVLTHTAPAAGWRERTKAVLNILRNASAVVTELIEARCHRGADIVRRLRFSEDVAEAIASLDEHWDGGGKPRQLKGEAVPLYSRIALLAQVAEVFHAGGGPDAAVAEVKRRAGSWFDPRLVTAFLQAAADGSLWLELEHEAEALGIAAVANEETFEVNETYLDDVAQAFADIIDAKTPFTGGHSGRVAEFADLIACELGFDAPRRRRLRRSALLHDIGKLGVSNSVLDKPGRLNEAEWETMRRHPVASEAILSRIAAFSDAARVGGAHHERLDGKGYPRGIGAAAINLDTRIVTVADVFDALTADRPYRSAMPIADALAILDSEIDRAFDSTCVAALKRNLNRSGASGVE